MYDIIVVNLFDIYIIQDSVKTYLRPYGIWWDGMGNNHFMANRLQTPVKEFRKSVNNWRRYGQK